MTAHPFANCACCLHCLRQAKADNPPTCDILGKLNDPGLLRTCRLAGYREPGHKHAVAHSVDHRASLRSCGLEGWE